MNIKMFFLQAAVAAANTAARETATANMDISVATGVTATAGVTAFAGASAVGGASATMRPTPTTYSINGRPISL